MDRYMGMCIQIISGFHMIIPFDRPENHRVFGIVARLSCEIKEVSISRRIYEGSGRDPGMTAFVEINTQEKDNVPTLDNITLQYRPDEAILDKVIYQENKKLEINEGFIYTFNPETKMINAIKIKKGITNGSITEIISKDISEKDKIISDFNYDGNIKQTKTPNAKSRRRRGPM